MTKLLLTMIVGTYFTALAVELADARTKKKKHGAHGFAKIKESFKRGFDRGYQKQPEAPVANAPA